MQSSQRRRLPAAVFLAALLLLTFGILPVGAATPTSLALTFTPAAPKYGGKIVAKATVTPVAPGTVDFLVDGVYATTVGVVGGVATASISLNANPGPHTLTANYNPASPAWDPATATVPLNVGPATATRVQWLSVRSVYLFGPPSGTVTYNALARYTVAQGNILTGRFVFRDLDTLTVVCDVPVSFTAGPTTAFGGCAIPLTVGVHRLSVEASGNYLSGAVPITVTVIAFP